MYEFERFMERKYAEAEEYSSGVTANEQGIAEDAWNEALRPIPLARALPALGQHVLLMDSGSTSGWKHVYRAVTDEVRWFYSGTGDIADVNLDWFSHWLPLAHQDSWNDAQRKA